MKIFRIAPIALPIKSDLKYGGIERGIFMLDEEFTRMGLESVVAASADSKIRGILCPTIGKSLWASGIRQSEEKLEEHCNKAIDSIINHEPNIIHDHEATLITSQAYQDRKKEFNIPILVTLHCTQESSKTREKLLKLFPINDNKIFFSAISHYLKTCFPEFNVQYVVYNGLEIEDFPYEKDKKDYLFSLGSITRTKGQDIAIEVAKRAEKNLFIGGPKEMNENDKIFWKEIKPYINKEYNIKLEDIPGFIESKERERRKGAYYLGVLDDAQKKEFFKRAKCFLMSIRGGEAFGRVVIEAMACGTPVIAFNKFSMPELIQNNKTGYLVDNIDDMVEKIKETNEISPYECREWVKQNFTQQKQSRDYLDIYKGVINKYENKALHVSLTSILK